MANKKVYLDNCCYNRPYDDQLQIRIYLEAQAKLYVQRLIVEKKLDMVYSFISRYENSQNPYDIRKNAIGDFFSNATIYVDESNVEPVRLKAEEIMQTGIKAKDALHVACAIFAHCDYFLTTDKRLLKFVTNEIKMMNPVDFVSGMGE